MHCLVSYTALLLGQTVASTKVMRAVVATGSASHEGDFSKVAFVSNRPVPQPGRDQVLIRVAASSVNPVDWKLLSEPWVVMRYPHVLGFDVAGVIEQVGASCTRLRIGDAVWADLGKGSVLHGPQLGAWAEFALADESQVSLKPSSLDFEGAASLPLVALTDYQALKKAGAPWSDRRNFTVVVTSGSGGTGIPALQMARAYGASQVITSASSKHATLLKHLGATLVIDYHKSSIWDVLPDNSVDIVYDNYGAPGTADAAMRAIRPGGVFIFLPGKNGSTSRNPKPGVKQINYGLCDSSNHEDLDALRDLANAGHLKPYIQESFSLEDSVEALNASFSGHVVGKVGISIANLTFSRETYFV